MRPRHGTPQGDSGLKELTNQFLRETGWYCGGQSEEGAARNGRDGFTSRDGIHGRRRPFTPVVMTRVPHEPGVAAAPPRTVRAPDGTCLPSEEPDGWSSVVPTSENHDPHDSQAFLAMRLLSRVFRATGEIEGGGGFLLGNQRFDVALPRPH